MPGTLCFSLALEPHLEPSFTALEVSLLITRYFETKGKFLKLKWPNDIWNEDSQKCCGVLLQNSHNVLIAGIGLNLYSDFTDFGGVYEAAFETEKKVWARELADFIIAHRYTDTGVLKKDWAQRCFHLNVPVTITESGETVTGVFTGLGSHGEALLETAEGEKRIYNGTLRPVTSARS